MSIRPPRPRGRDMGMGEIEMTAPVVDETDTSTDAEEENIRPRSHARPQRRNVGKAPRHIADGAALRSHALARARCRDLDLRLEGHQGIVTRIGLSASPRLLRCLNEV